MPTIYTDQELISQIKNAEATIATCNKNIAQAKVQLLTRHDKDIKKLLKAKDEPFGDVTLKVAETKIKVSVPKKVAWDQRFLADAYDGMKESGVNNIPIDIEYKIGEAVYKQLSDEYMEYFKDARTVAPGNISLKIIEEIEEKEE